MSLSTLTLFLKKKYKLNVKLINASNYCLKKLVNISNPEKKEKIGKLFIEIFEKEAKKFKNIQYLAQGTLYPDVIEVGQLLAASHQKLNLIITLEAYLKNEFKIIRTVKRII